MAKYNKYRGGTQVKNRLIGEELSSDEWANFCTTLHPYQEIREKCILEAELMRNSNSAACSLICYSYLCKYQKFNQNQIEELMFISSPFYHMVDATKENIDICCKILSKASPNTIDRTEQGRVIRIIVDSGLIKDQRLQRVLQDMLDNPEDFLPIRDRLDWYNLKEFQPNLPEFFIEKYSGLIPQKIYDRSQSYLRSTSVVHASPKNRKQRLNRTSKIM